MTVNFSERLFETVTGRQAEGLEAAIVPALLAQIDEDLALALQQLLDRLDDAVSADLSSSSEVKARRRRKSIEGKAVARRKICAPMIEASHMVQAPAMSESSRGWSGV